MQADDSSIQRSVIAAGRPEWGVIGWQSRIVCYELVDEWTEQIQPGIAGGVMRIPVRTGRLIPEARILGSETLLEMTPDLRAAIEADRRGRK